MLLIMLIMVISALFAFPSSASYADIGFNKNGLALKSLIRVKGAFFLQAEKYQTGESIGAGMGYTSNRLNVILTFNQLTEAEKSLNTELEAYYYDTSFNYSISMRYSDSGDVDLGASVGYAITEKVSVITKCDNKGAYLGLRVWIR